MAGYTEEGGLLGTRVPVGVIDGFAGSDVDSFKSQLVSVLPGQDQLMVTHALCSSALARTLSNTSITLQTNAWNCVPET